MNKIPTFLQVMEFTRTVSGCAALEDVEAIGLFNACLTVPKNGLVVEVGCQLGRSSSLIRQMALAIGFHTIHIDPYPSQPGYLAKWMAMMHQLGGDFTFLHMPTERVDHFASTLFYTGSDFAEYAIDLAFIDGDHEAHMVRVDLQVVAQRIRRGGTLTAHDYANPGLPGVKEALDPYVAHGWDAAGVFGSLGVWRRK